MENSFSERIKCKLENLKVELLAPWYSKALVILIVGYAFSPIDIIPDFIPFIGYLDDTILSFLFLCVLLTEKVVLLSIVANTISTILLCKK